MNFKIKINTIILLILTFTVFPSPYFSQRINNIMLLLVELLLLLWLFTRRFKSLKENKLSVLFAVFIFVCTFINFGFSSRIINAIITGVKIILLFSIIDEISKRSSYEYIVKIFFKIIIVILLFTDLTILVTRGTGIGGTDVLPDYLIGNKFVVSYLHMLFLCIYQASDVFSKNKFKRSFIFILLTCFSIMICGIVDCNTGIIGVMAVFLITVLSQNRIICYILEKPFIFIVVFVGLTFLLVGSNIILENPFVKQIIVNVFHRSMTLTGRLEMYNITLEAISLKPILGYGINSTYVEDVLSFGNAQNGLLKMLLDYGYMGTSVFLALCYKSFSRFNKKIISFKGNKAFSIFLYAMIICSMVEINISGIFYLGLALVNSSKIKK